jgi:hypothetical protein
VCIDPCCSGTPRSAVQLPSGRLIYGHADGNCAKCDGLMYGVISDDQGATWHKSSKPQMVPSGYELVETGLVVAGR